MVVQHRGCDEVEVVTAVASDKDRGVERHVRVGMAPEIDVISWLLYGEVDRHDATRNLDRGSLAQGSISSNTLSGAGPSMVLISDVFSSLTLLLLLSCTLRCTRAIARPSRDDEAGVLLCGVDLLLCDGLTLGVFRGRLNLALTPPVGSRFDADQCPPAHLH